MKPTATRWTDQGAIVVESIEDPKPWHGARMRHPKSAPRLLELFLKERNGILPTGRIRDS